MKYVNERAALRAVAATGAFACAAGFGAAFAEADDAGAERVLRDTIVVTGQKISGGEFGEKSGVPLDQVPQGIQVLSAEDLRNRNVRSIGDALRSVPSGNTGSARTSSYQSFTLKVRGFLADQMRNGVRQRYFEDVDASAISNIDRIEVLKGPSSVLFGQSALGGLISIVTKRPESEFSGSITGALGSFDQKRVGFDVTGAVSDDAGLYFRVNGELERSGTFVDFQDLDRENAAFSLTWNAANNVTAYLVTEWAERRTLRNPGLPIAGTIVSNGVGAIPIERFLGEPDGSPLEAFAPLVQAWVDIGLGSGWTLTPRFSYSGFDTNFIQLRVRSVLPDGVTVNRTGRFGKEDDNYSIGQIDLSGALRMAGMTHNILTGIEIDRERSTFHQENVPGVPTINSLAPVYGVVASRPYPTTFDLVGNIDGVAVYFQDVIDLTSRWNVVAGARWSTFDTFTLFDTDGVADPADIVEDELDHFTWQIGSTYRLDDRWSFFGGYGTGFDLENTAGGRAADGSPFDPEEADQIEAGVRFGGGSFRASASLFRIRRTNVLTTDPNDQDFLIQKGQVRVRGAEFEGQWSPAEGISLQGGYAFLDSEITKSNDGDIGDELADTPSHQANIFATWSIPKTPIELRVGANYVGSRKFSNARVDVFNGLLASSVTLPDYVTVDLGLAVRINETQLDLSLINLFDERYFTREFNDFSVLPGEPRQFTARITQSF